jgi:hypothetical protein
MAKKRGTGQPLIGQAGGDVSSALEDMNQDFDEATANAATGFSAFGGHLLAPEQGGILEASYSTSAAALASLGIEDAEQLIAVHAIPEVREELQSSLGLDATELEALVRQIQRDLPPDRVAAMAATSQPEFGLGVLPPTESMLAAAETSAKEVAAEAAVVALPVSVNLIPWMSPIRSQGPRGTCVSFALTALNEYIRRRRGLVRDLSEQHLYYEIKLIDGAPAACGTWQVKAVIALLNRGECREVVWPYNPNLPCNNHGARPPGARPDGLNYRLQTLAVPARNAPAYRTHMSKQRPVTVSIPVYNSWYQSAATRLTGRITMRIGSEPVIGGHAVCLVGYQDSASSPGGGYFIVRNSWGTTWASASPYGRGYGTIPYAYITNDAMEAFTAVVPGIGDEEHPEDREDEDEEDREDVSLKRGKGTVVIQAGPNIKITITTT